MSEQDKKAHYQESAKATGFQNADQIAQIKKAVDANEEDKDDGETAYKEGLYNNSDNQEPAPDFNGDK